MSRKVKALAQGRREFLTTLGAGAAGLAVGACGKCTTGKRSSGAFSNAQQTSALLPTYGRIQLLQPDIVGDGRIPDGYLKYPQQRFERIIKTKPGSGGPPITTMSAAWGPTPPPLGRNSFLEAVNEQLGIKVNPSVQDGNTYADKLSAILGARDVPDVLSCPNWEVDKIPRFSQAVKALFTDLTDYLKGDAVKNYPMLGAIPTSAWQHCVWGGRLAAIPFPNDTGFPWAMFYRQDLTEKAGVEAPSSIDALYEFGKKFTDPKRAVWAFGDTFEMIQMYFKCPNVAGGWRKKAGGGLEFKYETREYREALEFTARLYKEGMVHPELVATKGADGNQLFKSGRIMMLREGLGSWFTTQRDQQKINPKFKMQILPIFSATGGAPLAWADNKPIFYTFIKRGLGRERTQEILRVLNFCAAPFGSQEYELIQSGVEGKHFTRAPDRSPIATDLGRKEINGQYALISGRVRPSVGNAEVPSYVPESLAYARHTMKYVEENLFEGIKLELPANYSKVITITEDKIRDVVRGRRPISDLDEIVRDWRRSGGDDGRGFLEKVLTANGR